MKLGKSKFELVRKAIDDIKSMKNPFEANMVDWYVDQERGWESCHDDVLNILDNLQKDLANESK